MTMQALTKYDILIHFILKKKSAKVIWYFWSFKAQISVGNEKKKRKYDLHDCIT